MSEGTPAGKKARHGEPTHSREQYPHVREPPGRGAKRTFGLGLGRGLRMSAMVRPSGSARSGFAPVHARRVFAQQRAILPRAKKLDHSDALRGHHLSYDLLPSRHADEIIALGADARHRLAARALPCREPLERAHRGVGRALHKLGREARALLSRVGPGRVRRVPIGWRRLPSLGHCLASEVIRHEGVDVGHLDRLSRVRYRLDRGI
eukprot:3583697-Prymnesium_polylepis.1